MCLQSAKVLNVHVYGTERIKQSIILIEYSDLNSQNNMGKPKKENVCVIKNIYKL